MAYDIEQLTTLGNNVKSGEQPKLCFYYNGAGDTVTGADYFDDRRLNVGDIILELSDDYTALTAYRVSAVADGKATVVALTSITP